MFIDKAKITVKAGKGGDGAHLFSAMKNTSKRADRTEETADTGEISSWSRPRTKIP